MRHGQQIMVSIRKAPQIFGAVLTA